MRTRLVVSAVIALGVAGPATATAATVGVTHGGTLRYSAAAGEMNELYVNLQGGLFTIQDGTVGTRDTLYVHATSPCEHDTTAQPSPSLIDARTARPRACSASPSRCATATTCSASAASGR